MSNNNPLWVAVSTHVNTLEERRKILVQKKRNIEEQISEIEHSIALLKLLSPSPADSTTSTDGSLVNQKISNSNLGQVSNDPSAKSEFDLQSKEKRKRGGQWDHPDRNSVGKTHDNVEKVRKIIAIHQASREEGILMPMMTEPCRTFFKQVATPLQKCLQNHFDNNLSEFLQKHTKNGKLLHSKFNKLCSGNGCNCEQTNDVMNNNSYKSI